MCLEIKYYNISIRQHNLWEILWEMFPQHVISRGSVVPWPARSPDLSACDYFLWGYLKRRVFISKPRTVTELRQA